MATVGKETPEARTAIVRLLGLMRDGKEIRQYLDRFSVLDRARFAVIKVGGAVLRDDLPTLAEALAFLQTVGLTPVVIHGAGPQLDTAVETAGLETRKLDGLRVTPPEVLRIVREVSTAENLRLAEAVRAAGARAATIPLGVFQARLLDADRYGFVGEPTGAETPLIEAAVRAGAVPILTSLGETRTGQIVNINADSAVRALVTALEPYKIVMLTETGGVFGSDGKLLPTINLETDFDPLLASGAVTGGMRLKLEEIERLLAVLPLTSSVSMTRPDALAQELFTHTGAGTLVRRGERILAVDRKDDLDRARAERLVHAAFGRRPSPDWWPELRLARAYVTENFRAGAFLEELGGAGSGAGVVYLDKYAVDPDARGEGLGQAVWRQMRADHPVIVWRARRDNPVNDFYFREADGAAKVGPWVVFWIGLADFGRIAPLVEAVATRAATLEPAA